jgi:hypothetical protein
VGLGSYATQCSINWLQYRSSVHLVYERVVEMGWNDEETGTFEIRA